MRKRIPDRARLVVDRDNKPSILVVVAIIGAMATIVAALISLYGEVINTDRPIGATQTAESRLTGIAVTTQAYSAKVTDTHTPSATFPPTSTFTPLPALPLPPQGMAFIPAGDFIMGSNVKKDNEKPEHVVYVESFFIDIYETTNVLYKTCVDSGVCQPPRDFGLEGVIDEYYGNPEYDNYPVAYVDWAMAQAYCEWRGGRLPAETEWEKAARGTEGFVYPWGNEFLPYANYCDSNCDIDGRDPDNDDGYKYNGPIGMYPDGASPYGVMDMAGNVWEWVADWRTENYLTPTLQTPLADTLKRVIKGGSWFNAWDQVYASNRGGWKPNEPGGFLGFRCVQDVQP